MKGYERDRRQELDTGHPDETVVVGVNNPEEMWSKLSTTYHMAQCSVVRSYDDTMEVSRSEAKSMWIAPCKLCVLKECDDE